MYSFIYQICTIPKNDKFEVRKIILKQFRYNSHEDYVLNLFDKLGMTYHEDISQILRDVAKLGWFKKTIYVFTKKNN